MQQHNMMTTSSHLTFILLIMMSSAFGAQFTETSSSSSPSTCPLYWRLQNIGEELSVAGYYFNYTNDMVKNWDSYNCDSLPNALFRENFVINGASLVDYQYNLVMLESDIAPYCASLNSNAVMRNQTLELFEMFNNITLMTQYFVPYLDSLLIEKNFTIERIYFINGFDIVLQHGNTKANLFELVNAFNYFMFCKENNPYFKQFHTETLPAIVQQSAYPKVQTLDVIFGRNMEETCGMSTIPFFNRTLLCHCTSTSSNSSEITFETLSFFECSSVYVKFWVPLSSHPSLKIIEILFHILQMIVITIICFIPILVRNVKKWKDHMIARQNMTVIEKSQKKLQVSPMVSSTAKIMPLKEICSPSPSNASILPILNEETTSENCSTPIQVVSSQSDQVVISFEGVSTPVAETKEELPNKDKNAGSEQVRNSMKEHLQHELLRILCDMKLLTVVSLLMGVFCLFMNALLHAASYGINGTAVYPTTTFLIASLAFICVYNIPLAGSFVEVLLKLDGKNKKVSIHGL